MSPVNLTTQVEILEEAVDGPSGLVAEVDMLRTDFSQFVGDLRKQVHTPRTFQMRDEFCHSRVRHSFIFKLGHHFK